ncbi:hypothetical protein KIW84_058203 [Lathyrus oleraceus]|uniref:Arabidopsis retrotransposon Orf1 C-terminal domain-containing protein n=1 Tax=Pisum sativum TaxID=3888 RepID=A0A9D5ANR0_PEA|nr:hypothetical protein KIW84_058203 [Pisum sativum]
MPPRVVKPKRDINYMGVAFAEENDGENQRSRYHKLFKRDILAMRYPDDASLHDLGLFDNVHWMLNNLGMSHLFSLTTHTYIRLTYEFLSSFRYTAPIGGSCTTGTAHFRMFSRNYDISQDQMANLFLFPRGDELITSIALALNLIMELAMLEPLETPFSDLDYCRSMRLIKNKPGGKSFLMISNREAPEPDNEDEPDHMEQDAPHTGTHAHTTHAFPDSFTGTSSGYQPCEEYDYTAMRITLDDILSELKHRNDVDADRDVLLRSIHRQKEEMRITIDQIRETQLDFVERTELNMGDLTE